MNVMKSKRTRIKSAILKSYIVIIVMVLLLASVTYAWIKREWTPAVKGDNIKIASEGSLVFSLTDNADNSQSIFDLLNITNAPLKPVSSISGSKGEFFNVDFNDPTGYKYVRISSEESSTNLIKNYGLVEITFNINNPEADNDIKYIFFSPSSYFTAYKTDATGVAITDATDYRTEQTLRVAVSVDEQTPFIVKNQDRTINSSTDEWELVYDLENKPKFTHKAVTNKNTNGKYDADGKKFFDDEAKDAQYIEEKDVYPLSSYYGGIWQQIDDDKKPYYEDGVLMVYKDGGYVSTNADTTNPQTYLNNYKFDSNQEKWFYRNVSNDVDLTQCLAFIPSGDKVRFTVRVWIEGTDENCVSEIRDSLVFVNIMFDSISVKNAE